MNESSLLLKRNKMGHSLIRLHYSADPLKDGAWAEKEASKYLEGKNSLQWRREYEIDWSAGSGELVFPTFYEEEKRLTCDPFKLDETFNFFGGFDWGTRNPSAFVVVAESVDKRFFVVWEYYGVHKTPFELARVLRDCPYYNRLQWIASDPTIWTENIPKKESFTSVAEMLMDEDEVGNNTIDKIMPAHDRSDVAAINKFRNMWVEDVPRFMFFRNCGETLNEFRNLKYPARRETTNESEKILDKDNHLYDACKYFLLSHPFAQSIHEKHEFGTFGYLEKAAQEAESEAAWRGIPVQDAFNGIWGTEL